MQRRIVIKSLILGGVATVGGFAAWSSLSGPHAHLSIANALKTLTDLESEDLLSSSEWDPAKIFNHLAQSVEYSMSGFPEMKPPWFIHSAGALAFATFSAKGSMNHGLSEPIPGAPEIAAGLNVFSGIVRLKQALIEFDEFSGNLKPHFAYGQLDKTDYAAAHVMHLNNHLQELSRA